MAASTILLIEDNPAAREISRLALETEGHRVVEAADGASALSFLEHSRPDLILLDLVLPDIDGVELTRRIRERWSSEAVPIVIASGFIGQLEEVRALRDEYADVLLKPISPLKLVAVVKAQLTRRHDQDHVSADGKHILLVDDSPTQRRIDTLRLEKAHFRVTGVASAEAALEHLVFASPNLVITDVLMPGMDGFELCSLIRSTEHTAHIPTILISSYQDEGDLRRAKQAGASAFLARGPSNELIETAFEVIAGGPAQAPDPALGVSRGDHAQRLIQHLELYEKTQSRLEQQCALQAAELTLLGGIADAIARSADTRGTLRDVFAATLDAAGISSGALFLALEDGALELAHALGYAPKSADDFFGAAELLENIVSEKSPIMLPSGAVPESLAKSILARAQVASMQIVPLVLDGAGAGALVFGSRAHDLPAEGVVAFARAIGAQITMSLALLRAFERRRRAEQELKRANEELEMRVHERTSQLERSAQLQRDMLAFVSHDLRNPLNTISLGAQYLKTSTTADAGERVVQRIARASAQMQHMIDGLVDFASIEDGSFSLDRRPISLHSIFSDVLELLGPLAVAKSMTIEIERVEEVWLHCDADRVMQVLSNLIGNALKFSPDKSKILVSARVIEGDCELSVRDVGCGIKEENLPHVFDRYWHLPGTGRRGTGLGLAIAKGIVEAHGGHISVESVVGLGSAFRFTLPLTSSPVARG
jgi:signal transduction histidine kinase/DNA-binding response OmpR family regulator